MEKGLTEYDRQRLIDSMVKDVKQREQEDTPSAPPLCPGGDIPIESKTPKLNG